MEILENTCSELTVFAITELFLRAIENKNIEFTNFDPKINYLKRNAFS